VLPFCRVTTVFRRKYLFSAAVFITWLPRKAYPDLREKDPAFKDVLFVRSGVLEELDFDFPSPSVAKAPAAKTVSKTNTASFLLKSLLILNMSWFIATKIKTKKNIKQTVYPEL
jgi:hypothetical protein